MAIIVSDTSPLRALNHLGLVDLLEKFFGEVLIPQAVADELLQANQWCPSLDVHQWPFLRIVLPSRPPILHAELLSLDQGEREAIQIAEEVGADLLPMDEAAGRRAAERLGLKVAGTLSVLLRGKQRGVIDTIRPLAQRLCNEIHFFLASDFLEAFLRQAGE